MLSVNLDQSNNKSLDLSQFVYSFACGKSETLGLSSKFLGRKGFNLCKMLDLGLPIPPGIIVDTRICLKILEDDADYSNDLLLVLLEKVKVLEKESGKQFGSHTNPLLVSVRSGSSVSMPGMMDTILNLGINDSMVESLVKKYDPRFVYDLYRRFIATYADVVMGVDHGLLSDIVNDKKLDIGINLDSDFTSDDLKEIISSYKEVIFNSTGKNIPQDLSLQLKDAINAVFQSWNNERAISYRNLYNIPHNIGTAIVIQKMVFGNLNDQSATGVVFTRNPSTGEKYLYGEYMLNAQGEDIVAGVRTPYLIHGNDNPKNDIHNCLPEVSKQLNVLSNLLEQHFRYPQDIEFTVEDNHLWLLQTRNAKINPIAEMKILVDMEKEGFITKEQALSKVNLSSVNHLLHPTAIVTDKNIFLTKGLPASPGGVSGRVVLLPKDIDAYKKNGDKIIFVREETTADDISSVTKSDGIITTRGGMTSHAAVITRGMGKSCITAASAISINSQEGYFTVNGVTVKKGDYVTINGHTGKVYLGEANYKPSDFTDDLKELISWSDKFRKLSVRMNAENKTDIQVGLNYGVEGIGLCRTEHMFFLDNRIGKMVEMIISDTKEDRESALKDLFLMQKEDFLQIFTQVNELPVNIRLLDPPLHEFLHFEDKTILHNVAKNYR